MPNVAGEQGVIRTLPDEVEVTSDSTQNVSESVESESHDVGVQNKQGDRSPTRVYGSS